MTFCKRCGVKIKDNEETCILCGSSTERLNENKEGSYPTIHFSNRFRYLVRVSILLSIVLVGLSLGADILWPNKIYWFLITLATVLFAWIVFFIRKSFRNYGLMIYVQVISIAVLGYIVDFSTGNHGWMLNYVFPFLIIGAQCIMIAVMVVKPMLFRDFVLYELQIGILGILSVLLLVFQIVKVQWPFIIACIFSAIILIGTFIFADRKMKQEFIKRFHV